MASPRNAAPDTIANPTNVVHGILVRDLDHGLPEGSSLFQEVMAELNPHTSHHSPPKSPGTGAPRRRNGRAKHVHYASDEVKATSTTTGTWSRSRAENTVNGMKKKVEREEEDDDREDEEGGGDGENSGKQILHGKCHCYFVERGNVTGLADHQCQHEHRRYVSSTSPASSPHISRKFPHSPSSPSSSVPGRESPRSPGARPHLLHPLHHHNHHHHSLSPDLEDFRGRSHSDTTAMARLSQSKRKTTPASTSVSHSHGKAASASSSPKVSSYTRKNGVRDSPETSGRRSTPVQRSSSCRHSRSSDLDLAQDFSASLRLRSPLQQQQQSLIPIVVYDVSDPRRRLRSPSGSESGPGSGSETVKTKLRSASSSHVVSSDQLHYLYDQFLHVHPGPAGH